MTNVLIWGTGKIAEEIYINGINGNIIGFIQTEKNMDEYRSVPVYSVEERWPKYDYVIVANSYSNEIYEECLKKGYNIDKFIFMCPVTKKIGGNDLEKIRGLLKEKNYINYCIMHGHYQNTFFAEDLKMYNEKNTRKNFYIDEGNIWPIISDKYAKAGIIGNYFWQDLWAAKLIKNTCVKEHFDIGSRIDGFIAHLLAMGIDVTLIDIREFPYKMDGLHTIIDDATMLNQIADQSIDSMSALCSLEHFGLGRYGDPVDPEACFKCFREIQKKVKQGGNLYISLPIGRERVEFNAHRVFFASTVIECFHTMNLVEFSCTAEGKIEYNVDIHKYDNDEHNGEHRYGLFHFMKSNK